MSSEDVNLSGGRDRGLGRVGGKKKKNSVPGSFVDQKKKKKNSIDLGRMSC